ncbi:MAG: DMT family transporter [Inquilinus sp.]|nr:DMT family transporter [Inquilinus sp.]
MPYFFIAFAIMGGAVLPLQALINSRLGGAMNGPVWAATISFAIGTIGLLIFQLAKRTPIPSAEQATSVPAWAWAGGLLGAFYVVAATTTVSRLGAAAMISLGVLGQMLASLLLDHFGVLSGSQPINLAKVAGALMLLGGVVLIVWNR